MDAKNDSSWATRTNRTGCFEDVCVLVVDFDPISLHSVTGMLRDSTYGVMVATRAREALEIIEDKECGADILLVELHMPDMRGFEFLEQIKETSDLPVLVMSADVSEDSMLGSLERGAQFYYSKPVSVEDVEDIWQYAVTRRKKKLKLAAEKKKKAAIEAVMQFFAEMEYKSSGDEGSAVSGWKYTTDDEEDALVSPLRKKARLSADDSPAASETAAGGSGLYTDLIEEDHLIPPPQPAQTPPTAQGVVKPSEAGPEDDDSEESDAAAAKGGDDPLSPN